MALLILEAGDICQVKEGLGLAFSGKEVILLYKASPDSNTWVVKSYGCNGTTEDTASIEEKNLVLIKGRD